MDQKKIKKIGESDSHLEHCWVLLGNVDNKLWVARRRQVTKGTPATVDFDPYYVRTREQTKHDVIGFYHTHPTFPAVPSSTDYDTMRAWVNACGKPLVCVIQGIDGLRGWWFDDDESDPIECQVMRVGSLVFGTTEIDEDEENVIVDRLETDLSKLEAFFNTAVEEEFMPEDETRLPCPICAATEGDVLGCTHRRK